MIEVEQTHSCGSLCQKERSNIDNIPERFDRQTVEFLGGRHLFYQLEKTIFALFYLQCLSSAGYQFIERQKTVAVLRSLKEHVRQTCAKPLIGISRHTEIDSYLVGALETNVVDISRELIGVRFYNLDRILAVV